MAPIDDSDLPEPPSFKRLYAALIAAVIALLGVFGFTVAKGDPSTPAVTTTTVSVPPTVTTITNPNEALAEFDNPGGMDFGDDAEQTAEDVQRRGFDDEIWTGRIFPMSTGPSPNQGQFRLSCTPSHWLFDDPIVHPDEPGAAHMHMFFGNTAADADSTVESLLDGGASTCQGGALNRSAYWMPTMLDGDGNVVVPRLMTLYYKSHRPQDVELLPQGVQMLAGNVDADSGGMPRDSFKYRESLHWGCSDGSQARQLSALIPGTPGTRACPSGWPIQATIQFPQCFAVDSNGDPVLTSDDFVSHTYHLENAPKGQRSDCPGSHPYRTVQISYLVTWDNPAGMGERGWHLSSDSDIHLPGGTLHADWLGAWNDDAQTVWLDGCIRAERNCSQGQTGTARRFRPIVGSRLGAQIYRGPRVLGGFR